MLCFPCDNDVADDLLFQSGYRHGPLVEGSPKWGIWTRPLQILVNEMEIGKRLKIVAGSLRRRSTLGEADADPALDNLAEPLEPGLDRLKEITLENGAELIVSWTGGVDQRGGSYEWLQGWAERNGVRFADWQPRALAVTTAIPELDEENPHSGGRYRPWLNRVIAETFGDAVLDAAGTHGIEELGSSSDTLTPPPSLN